MNTAGTAASQARPANKLSCGTASQSFEFDSSAVAVIVLLRGSGLSSMTRLGEPQHNSRSLSAFYLVPSSMIVCACLPYLWVTASWAVCLPSLLHNSDERVAEGCDEPATCVPCLLAALLLSGPYACLRCSWETASWAGSPPPCPPWTRCCSGDMTWWRWCWRGTTGGGTTTTATSGSIWRGESEWRRGQNCGWRSETVLARGKFHELQCSS